VLAREIGHRHAAFGFLQDLRDLALTELRFAHETLRLGESPRIAGITLRGKDPVTDQYGKFTARATEYPIRPCFTVDGKIYSDFFIVNDHKEDPIKLRCNLPLGTSGHFEDGHVCYGGAA
jgi:hypothetical protein